MTTLKPLYIKYSKTVTQDGFEYQKKLEFVPEREVWQRRPKYKGKWTEINDNEVPTQVQVIIEIFKGVY